MSVFIGVVMVQNEIITYFICSHISRSWVFFSRFVPHSERLKRILLGQIHHLNVVVFHPRSQKKVLKLHRTRDQILHSKQQNPRKFCSKEVNFVTSRRETSGRIRLAAQHSLPARKKRIRPMTFCIMS